MLRRAMYCVPFCSLAAVTLAPMRFCSLGSCPGTACARWGWRAPVGARQAHATQGQAARKCSGARSRQDTLPEWTKRLDLSSTRPSCVGSTSTCHLLDAAFDVGRAQHCA